MNKKEKSSLVIAKTVFKSRLDDIIFEILMMTINVNVPLGVNETDYYNDFKAVVRSCITFNHVTDPIRHQKLNGMKVILIGDLPGIELSSLDFVFEFNEVSVARYAETKGWTYDGVMFNFIDNVFKSYILKHNGALVKSFAKTALKIESCKSLDELKILLKINPSLI